MRPESDFDGNLSQHILPIQIQLGQLTLIVALASQKVTLRHGRPLLFGRWSTSRLGVFDLLFLLFHVQCEPFRTAALIIQDHVRVPLGQSHGKDRHFLVVVVIVWSLSSRRRGNGQGGILKDEPLQGFGLSRIGIVKQVGFGRIAQCGPQHDKSISVMGQLLGRLLFRRVSIRILGHDERHDQDKDGHHHETTQAHEATAWTVSMVLPRTSGVTAAQESLAQPVHHGPLGLVGSLGRFHRGRFG